MTGPDQHNPSDDTSSSRSSAEDHPGDSLTPVREAVLDAMLTFAPFEGWTMAALRRAAAEAGIDRTTLRRAFPKGIVDLLDLYAARCDRTMVEALQAMDLGSMRIRDRVTTAVRVRFEAMIPHKSAAREGMTVLANPIHAATAARLVWRTADRIWRTLGDTSTDANFYSKRTILSGVLTSTTLVFFEDRSEGHGETWAFLDRRIGDVMSFETVKRQVQNATKNWPSPLGLAAALRYPSRKRG